jgi:hypothetical protein
MWVWRIVCLAMSKGLRRRTSVFDRLVVSRGAQGRLLSSSLPLLLYFLFFTSSSIPPLPLLFLSSPLLSSSSSSSPPFLPFPFLSSPGPTCPDGTLRRYKNSQERPRKLGLIISHYGRHSRRLPSPLCKESKSPRGLFSIFIYFILFYFILLSSTLLPLIIWLYFWYSTSTSRLGIARPLGTWTTTSATVTPTHHPYPNLP